MGIEHTINVLASKIHKHSRRLYRPWWNIQETKSDVEVPLIFRETYIVSGYRIPDQSWTYYLSSICHLHNESGNVWSHFIAVLIYFYKAFELSQLADITKEPLTWPILAFLLCDVAYAALSTFAHLCHSKSPLIHYVCYQVDYIGIGLNCFGTSVLFYYFTGSESYYEVMTPTLFMGINTVLSVVVCVIFSVAKLRYSRPYPPHRKFWMIASVSGHLLFGTIPLIFATKHCIDEPDCSLPQVLPHYYGYGWIFVSAYFFASHTPERFAPGRFDIFGHGHQFFHMFAILTSLQQFSTVISEVGRRPRELTSKAEPDILVIFGSLTAVVALCCVFIVLTHRHRIEKVSKDAELERLYNKME